jgi:hypothetical protein
VHTLKKGEEGVVVHAMAVLKLAMFVYTWGLGFGVAREASEDVSCMGIRSLAVSKNTTYHIYGHFIY